MVWGTRNVKKDGTINDKQRHGKGDRLTLRNDWFAGLPDA